MAPLHYLALSIVYNRASDVSPSGAPQLAQLAAQQSLESTCALNKRKAPEGLHNTYTYKRLCRPSGAQAVYKARE